MVSMHRLKSITVLILARIYACHEAIFVDLVSKSATYEASSLILRASVAVLHTSSTCFNKHTKIPSLFLLSNSASAESIV